MSRHRVSIRCWTCGAVYDVRALSGPLPECCFDTLVEVGAALNTGVVGQFPYHLGRLLEKQAQFQDAIADAMAVSPNPELRKAALQWRNARAAKKRT